ncbi:unnamed protein product [Porites lobata]|uniref:Uncharacterized protein n=1 Tax=Porites lobata TaxID=104759 RepID=A0ABN8NMB2_9CNID|nr:unnamed protein product [Porites lobata]
MIARPRATFAHTKTVRLIVEDNMEINALETVRSLPDFQEEITGIVPNFGGKCFDITLRSTEAATRLATSGFDYGASESRSSYQEPKRFTSRCSSPSNSPIRRS